jgi:hypothetical protein
MIFSTEIKVHHNSKLHLQKCNTEYSSSVVVKNVDVLLSPGNKNAHAYPPLGDIEYVSGIRDREFPKIPIRIQLKSCFF